MEENASFGVAAFFIEEGGVFEASHHSFKAGAVVYHLFSEKCTELLLIDSELRFHLLQGLQKILSLHFEGPFIDHQFLAEFEDICGSADGVGGCAFDQCLNLGACKILGQPGQFFNLDVSSEQIVLSQVLGVDPQNLLPSCSVGQMHLYMHLEPARSEDGLIEQILAIGHPDDHDVVEGLHSVDVCQQLVDHLVAHLRAHSPVHAPLLAYRVDLVEDYYVQGTAVAQLLLVCAGLREQLSDVFL